MFLEVKENIFITRRKAAKIDAVVVRKSSYKQETYYVKIIFEPEGGREKSDSIELYSGTPTLEAARTKALFLQKSLERFIQGECVDLPVESY